MMTAIGIGAALAIVALLGGVMWAEKYLPEHLKEGYVAPPAPEESAPQFSVEPAPVKEQEAVNDNELPLQVAA